MRQSAIAQPSSSRPEVLDRSRRRRKRRANPERENFNHALFALAFFSRRQDRELLGAISRGLLDCPRTSLRFIASATVLA